MDTHIWYFAEKGRGIVTTNILYFDVVDEGIVFHLKEGEKVAITGKEDVAGFKGNILELDE